ncbi:MAG: hypothetical protein WBW06_14100, partial [Xanthobacteraceae bacterium]
MSRRRRLSDEERAVWTGYSRSITPLDPAREPVETTEPPTGDEPASAPPPRPAVRQQKPLEK